MKPWETFKAAPEVDKPVPTPTGTGAQGATVDPKVSEAGVIQTATVEPKSGVPRSLMAFQAQHAPGYQAARPSTVSPEDQAKLGRYIEQRDAPTGVEKLTHKGKRAALGFVDTAGRLIAAPSSSDPSATMKAAPFAPGLMVPGVPGFSPRADFDQDAYNEAKIDLAISLERVAPGWRAEIEAQNEKGFIDEDAGGVENVANAVDQAFNLAADNLALQFLTKGTSVVPVAGHGLGYTAMLKVEAGAFAIKARKMGLPVSFTQEYADMYGALSGAVEYLQQLMLLGQAKGRKGKKGGPLDIRKEALRKFANTSLGKRLLTELRDAGIEGVEEMTQGGLERAIMLKMAARWEEKTGQKLDVDEWDWKGDFITGAAVSAVHGGTRTGVDVVGRQRGKAETEFQEILAAEQKENALHPFERMALAEQYRKQGDERRADSLEAKISAEDQAAFKEAKTLQEQEKLERPPGIEPAGTKRGETIIPLEDDKETTDGTPTETKTEGPFTPEQEPKVDTGPFEPETPTATEPEGVPDVDEAKGEAKTGRVTKEDFRKMVESGEVGSEHIAELATRYEGDASELRDMASAARDASERATKEGAEDGLDKPTRNARFEDAAKLGTFAGLADELAEDVEKHRAAEAPAKTVYTVDEIEAHRKKTGKVPQGTKTKAGVMRLVEFFQRLDPRNKQEWQVMATEGVPTYQDLVDNDEDPTTEAIARQAVLDQGGSSEDSLDEWYVFGSNVAVKSDDLHSDVIRLFSGAANITTVIEERVERIIGNKMENDASYKAKLENERAEYVKATGDTSDSGKSVNEWFSARALDYAFGKGIHKKAGVTYRQMLQEFRDYAREIFKRAKDMRGRMREGKIRKELLDEFHEAVFGEVPASQTKTEREADQLSAQLEAAAEAIEVAEQADREAEAAARVEEAEAREAAEAKPATERESLDAFLRGLEDALPLAKESHLPKNKWAAAEMVSRWGKGMQGTLRRALAALDAGKTLTASQSQAIDEALAEIESGAADVVSIKEERRPDEDDAGFERVDPDKLRAEKKAKAKAEEKQKAIERRDKYADVPTITLDEFKARMTRDGDYWDVPAPWGTDRIVARNRARHETTDEKIEREYRLLWQSTATIEDLRASAGKLTKRGRRVRVRTPYGGSVDMHVADVRKGPSDAQLQAVIDEHWTPGSGFQAKRRKRRPGEPVQQDLLGQDEGGFRLVGEEGTDGERVVREQEAKEKAAEEAEKAQGDFGFQAKRVTPEQDAEYMAAVESGDTEAAQKMVDEAAKAAGYAIGPVYHGDTRTGLRRLDPWDSIETSGAVWFSDSDDVANIFRFERDFGTVVTEVWNDDTEEYDELEGGDLVSAHLRIDNALELTDETDPTAQDVSDDSALQQRVVDEAKAAGHDGIILREVREGVGDWTEQGTTYAVFSDTQGKSANPITEDDNGNVIPLSERFDETTPDINYQARRAEDFDQHKYSKRVSEDDSVTPELAKIAKDRLHEIAHNEETIDEAMDHLETGGLKTAKDVFLEDKSGMSGHVRVALGMALLRAHSHLAQQAKDDLGADAHLAVFKQVVSKLDELGLQAGRQVQIFRAWGDIFEDPALALRYYQKTLVQAKREQTLAPHEDTISILADQVPKLEAERANAAANASKVKSDVERVLAAMKDAKKRFLKLANVGVRTGAALKSFDEAVGESDAEGFAYQAQRKGGKVPPTREDKIQAVVKWSARMYLEGETLPTDEDFNRAVINRYGEGVKEDLAEIQLRSADLAASFVDRAVAMQAGEQEAAAGKKKAPKKAKTDHSRLAKGTRKTTTGDLGGMVESVETILQTGMPTAGSAEAKDIARRFAQIRAVLKFGKVADGDMSPDEAMRRLDALRARLKPGEAPTGTATAEQVDAAFKDIAAVLDAGPAPAGTTEVGDVETEFEALRKETKRYADKKALRKLLRPGLINTTIRAHYAAMGRDLDDLVLDLRNNVGLSEADAQSIAERVDWEFNRLAKKNRKKAIQAALDNAKIVRGKADNSAVRKIVAKIEAGALTEDMYAAAFAEQYNLSEMTALTAKGITSRVEAIKKAPDGFLKDRATQDLMGFMATESKVKAGDIGWSLWYASILSGYQTHQRNIVSTFWNTVFDIHAAALSGSDKKLGYSFKNLPFAYLGALQGIRSGFVEAAAVMKEGGVPVKAHVTKIEAPPILENFKTWWAAAKFVARAMVAEDMVFFKSAQESRAYMMAADIAREEGGSYAQIWRRTREIVGHTSALEAKYEAQARAEPGVKSALDVKRRKFELMEQNRPDDIQSGAADFGARATFNYTPEGSVGLFAVEFQRSLIKNFGPVGRFLMPFANIVANVTNASIDYSPVGLIRAKYGMKQMGGGRRMPDIHEYNVRVAKAMSSSALLATINLMAHLSMDDDDDPETFKRPDWVPGFLRVPFKFAIHGAGPTKHARQHQLREAHWRPYSVQFGENYVSYQYTPLVWILSIMGNMHDRERYHDMDDWDLSIRTAYAFLMGGRTILDMSFLTGVAGMFDMLQTDNADRATVNFQRYVSRYATSGIPNLAKQVGKLFDPKVRQADDIAGFLMNDIPGLRLANKPRLNSLGGPAEFDLGSMASWHNKTDAEVTKMRRAIASIVGSTGLRTNDPVYHLLARKQVWISGPSKTLSIKEPGQLHSVVMNEVHPEMLYDLLRLYGPRLYDDIKRNLDRFETMETADIHNEIKDMLETRRDEAKELLLRDPKYFAAFKEAYR